MKEYIELLLPMEKESSEIQSKNIIRLREDMRRRYYDASDLQRVGNNAYRFINAVSDFATHATPLRRTANYNDTGSEPISYMLEYFYHIKALLVLKGAVIKAKG